MRRIDWDRIDTETQFDLDLAEMDHSYAAAVETGLRRFRRRLWLGQLMALAVVLGITAAAYVVRDTLHATSAVPVAVPVVTGLSPAAGPEEGGEPVLISGAGFTDDAIVFFGDVEMGDVDVQGDDRIRIVAPSGAGVVNVVVTTAAGSSLVGPENRYQYLPPSPPPTIDTLDPDEGSEEGGTKVTIQGTGLASTSEVTFGGTPATDLEVLDDDEVVATSPAGEGTVEVEVTTAFGGAGGLEFRYTAEPVAPPVLTRLVPVEGPESGGTPVTLTGTGLSTTTAVLFGDSAGTGLVVVSDTEIRVETPRGLGEVPVRVTAEGGTTPADPDLRFRYLADPEPPTVTRLDPAEGTERGGTTVRIGGTNLVDVVEVRFGGVLADRLVENGDGTVTVVTPPGTGTVDVVATTSGGTSPPSEVARFTYVTPARPPLVTGVDPGSGSPAGGNTVEIRGSGLSNVQQVMFGDVSAVYTVVSDTLLTAIAPAGDEGSTVDVRVTTPVGTSPRGPTYGYNIQ